MQPPAQRHKNQLNDCGRQTVEVEVEDRIFQERGIVEIAEQTFSANRKCARGASISKKGFTKNSSMETEGSQDGGQ